MKKIFKMYLLYMLQLTFIGIFVLVLIAYNLQTAQKSFLENRMYSGNVIGIQLSDYRTLETVELDIEALPKSNFMIYKFLSEELNETVRGVYGTKDVFEFSNYISDGRFFDQQDYTYKTPTTVIGSAVLPLTVEENGKRYYLYNQEKFEVIGIFKNTGTELDNAAYLNLTYLLSKTDNKGLYYIDSTDNEIVKNVIEYLKENAQGKYETMDVKYESTITYELGKANTTLLIFSVLASIFCLVITTIFFVSHQKYTVAIKKLCGMTKRDIILVYGKNMVLTVGISFSLIILIIPFLQKFSNSIFSIDTLNLCHYIISAITLLAIAAFNSFHIAHLSENINISSTLKGI